MRFSVFCGQDGSTLTQADEIHLRQKDIDMLLDLIEKFPDKDYVVDIENEISETTWQMLKACNQKIGGTVYCCLYDIYLYQECKQYDLPFFYAFPANSFFELKSLKELGVSYVRLGMPIFFQMADVATFGIPIRITPNKAFEEYIPRKNGGICGQWVRPEDLHLYEPYGATICEFRTQDISVENPLIFERTLLHIYKDRKEWPGRLNNIVKDLGNNCYNIFLEEDIGKHRLNCKQICQLDKCHYCPQAMSFANTLENKYKK